MDRETLGSIYDGTDTGYCPHEVDFSYSNLAVVPER